MSDEFTTGDLYKAIELYIKVFREEAGDKNYFDDYMKETTLEAHEDVRAKDEVEIRLGSPYYPHTKLETKIPFKGDGVQFFVRPNVIKDESVSTENKLKTIEFAIKVMDKWRERGLNIYQDYYESQVENKKKLEEKLAEKE